jgi:steroid delta-isomerase-like uncharacterized protein
MADAKRVAAEWNKAFNAHDEDRMRELTAEDAVFTAPGGVRIEGRDALLEYAMGWLDAFPDGRITVERRIVSENLIVEEYTFEGTHEGTLPGPAGDIHATGRTLKARVADVTRVEDGKMVEANLYFDQVEVLTQLGVVRELARV